MNLNLIKGLQFAEKVNMTEAITESGKELLKNYRGYLYTNPASYGLVNGFIQEARKQTYDNGVATILEAVLKYVTENNISWKIATVCESIANSNDTYDYIKKVGAATAEKLLDMNEADVKQYIKAGALKSIQYIPEFRNICKEVYGASHVNETVNDQFSLTNPLSYAVVTENETWFAVNGKTYCIKEGKASNVVSEDATFNQMNSFLPNFTRLDEDKLHYEYQDGWNQKPYSFTISENSIEFEHGTIKESFNNVIDFKQYCDNFSVTMVGGSKQNFMNTSMNVAFVQENMGNVCEVDCAKVLESSNGTIATIVEGKDNVLVSVDRSSCCKNQVAEFALMTEACDTIKRIAGVNIRPNYDNRINEELKLQDPESYSKIQEQLAAQKDAKIEARRAKIQQLAEAYKNDPVKIALLSNISKELNMLEA